MENKQQQTRMVKTKERHDYRMPSKCTLSRPRDCSSRMAVSELVDYDQDHDWQL